MMALPGSAPAPDGKAAMAGSAGGYLLRLRTGWSWEALAVLIGFALTLTSLVGGQFYLAPALQSVGTIDSEIAASQAKVKMTRAALALDNLTQQLGGNVFSVQPGAERDPAGAEALLALEQRRFAHRHDGVRAFIAELGVAGEVDFSSASAAYSALVDAEKRNFTLQTYQATNDFEAKLATQTTNDEIAELAHVAALQRSRPAARGESERRALLLALASSLGAASLMIAALKASSGAPTPRPPAEEPRETAVALLAEALHEARSRIDASRSAA
jgi:hypothetical protein